MEQGPDEPADGRREREGPRGDGDAGNAQEGEGPQGREQEDEEEDEEESGEDEPPAPRSADNLRVAGACIRALQDCNQHPLPPKSYECPVCLDTASESWPHERRWLGLPGCGHVVCSSCALSLANVGKCECPLCRQCWHLPELQVGSRVTILYNECADDREETPPDGKGLAARRADGEGGGGGRREPANERAAFWSWATELLHRRSGRVEALGDASTRRAVAVRLDEAVGDESEGTGLEVAVVGVPEPHLFSVEEDTFPISPSMADALARPTAYSLAQLEALGLLPRAVLLHCSACESRKPSSVFSNKQLKRRDGRCKACVDSRRFAPPPTSGVEPRAELADALCETEGEGTLQQQAEVQAEVITTGSPPDVPCPPHPSPPPPSREATASPAPSSLSFTCLGTEKLSKMAMSFFKSDAIVVAQRVAHMALEEAAAAVGGESEKEASARQRGVSLSRNVLAMAADQLAQQGWAETLALNEQLVRSLPDILSAARNVKESAMDAAGAVDAQLGDVDLLSHVGEDERRKLEAKRAQSTALLERATELIRSVEREAAETSDGKAAAMQARLQARIESSRDENSQLQAELARALLERDQAIETRDDMLSTMDQQPIGAADTRGAQPDCRAVSEKLKERLRDGHWTLCRQGGGHPVYKRTVVLQDATETTVQVFSHASTASDWRSMHNALSDLRAKDNGVLTAMPLADGVQPALFVRRHELHKQMTELQAQVNRVAGEIAMNDADIENAY